MLPTADRFAQYPSWQCVSPSMDGRRSENATTYVRPGARYESSASETTSTRFPYGAETRQMPPLQFGAAPRCTYAEHGWSGHEFMGARRRAGDEVGPQASATPTASTAQAIHLMDRSRTR